MNHCLEIPVDLNKGKLLSHPLPPTTTTTSTKTKTMSLKWPAWIIPKITPSPLKKKSKIRNMQIFILFVIQVYTLVLILYGNSYIDAQRTYGAIFVIWSV